MMCATRMSKWNDSNSYSRGLSNELILTPFSRLFFYLFSGGTLLSECWFHAFVPLSGPFTSKRSNWIPKMFRHSTFQAKVLQSNSARGIHSASSSATHLAYSAGSSVVLLDYTSNTTQTLAEPCTDLQYLQEKLITCGPTLKIWRFAFGFWTRSDMYKYCNPRLGLEHGC